VTKPKPLTEKQIHFFEAWGLPIQPSFGYAHGLINYLCNKPGWWSTQGIPKKTYTAHMIDNFWTFHNKWVGKDVLVIIPDKEKFTITHKAFTYVTGVVTGIVGRPVGECAFLKAKFGHVTGYLKLMVLLEGTAKPKVIGIGKVVQVRYNGEMIPRDQFYDLYKRHVEYKSQNAWTIKQNRGKRLLTSHLISAKVGRDGRHTT
jgi:hypothetical protein